MSFNTVDERLAQIELALKTLIVFNHNAASVLGRRIATGNDAIANALAQDFREMKGQNRPGIDNTMHDSYIDNLILGITGKD
ncbi:hypothetical protein [Pseudomonas chlororaphis]|uniref:hypothetical protein n=1 Tax=Pseudomonas chlororaphis TaxID=587753 RepID=UPI000F58DB30|nr:hypothetical protein [Pseudomonas chlororaphis]